MKNGLNRLAFETLQKVIKFTIGIGVIVFTLHVGLILFFDINEPITEWFCGYSSSGFIMLLITSHVIKLCFRYRLCLVYEFLISQCILVRRLTEIFNNCLNEALLVSFIIGVLVILLIIFQEAYEVIKSKIDWESLN